MGGPGKEKTLFDSSTNGWNDTVRVFLAMLFQNNLASHFWKWK